MDDMRIIFGTRADDTDCGFPGPVIAPRVARRQVVGIRFAPGAET